MISTVYIAKNVYGGDGLGRLGDGRVVFVPGAWEGEQVRAEIVEEKKHFVKARLIEVVEKSPDRIESQSGPVVPGMVYAGLSYDGELRVKERQLVDFFERARIALPKTDGVLLVRGGSERNYRNKVVYHLGKKDGRWVIGYRLESSHEIVDVVEDPLASPEINAKLPEIRRAVMTLLTTGPISVRRATEAKGELTIRWTKKSGVKWWLGAAPLDVVLKESAADIDFEVPAGGFYQVNPEVGERLVREVVDVIRANRNTVDQVLDLYCGVGVFGISALHGDRGGLRLTGIESGRQAIDFARKNAAVLKRDQREVRFFAEEVGRNLRRIAIGGRTAVIIDPPRDGLEKGVAKWLARSKAPLIVYVSCDPATLMRDLKEICAGQYRVKTLRWFNMFPRTARFESMVVLEKQK